MRKNIIMSYSLALIVIFIWSVTFVSTKILLDHLSPTEILFYRYVTAYILFFAANPRIMWPLSLRDEAKFAFAGLTGVTLYFLCENFALSFSTASNVSLLVATALMMTGLVSHFMTKSERITVNFIYGCVFGLAGVFLIVFNGHFVLKLNPAGDMLAIMAALFCLLFDNYQGSGQSRIFCGSDNEEDLFYSIMTLIPLLLPPFQLGSRSASRKEVFGNLIFLGVFASALCFLLWNRVIWELGAVKANNLIYLTLR